MVAVNIPVKSAVRAGLNLGAMVAGDASNGNSYNNSGATLVIAKNTGATPRVCTIVTSKTVDGLAVADRSPTIPAGETWVFGPYDVDTYGTVVTLMPAHAEVTFWAIEP
jgi:hypothetical protein